MKQKGCPIDSPRLTESLPGPKHPNECQSCGGSNLPGFGNGILRLTVDRWQEHDHKDFAEQRIVVLCEKCARRLIEPHPRLYAKLPVNQPWPGAMAICVDCRLRDGIGCTSPRAKANGGDGVMIKIEHPITGMIDSRSYSGPIALWPKAAHACDQREATK